MTSPVAHRAYVLDDLLVVEWTILTDDGTAPMTDPTVSGTVRLPDGTSTSLAVGNDGNVFRLTYQFTQAGRHVYHVTSEGSAVGAIEGVVRVPRAAVGAEPITVDPTTDIGKIRLLATDLDEADPLFEDAQITAFLALESSNVKRAAALAIETIALSEGLISKVLTTSDGLTTDGAKLHDSLLKRAKALRDQADEEAGDPDDYGIDVVDFDPLAAYRTLL